METRRNFLKKSIAASAATCIPANNLFLSSKSGVLGANDKINLGVIGCGSLVKRGDQGKVHIERFRQIPGVRIIALCDVDENVLNREVKKFTDRDEKVRSYVDVRQLLEDKDIDAVTIATPDHWHALITVWACQAGKDVFVEKPASHNIWEGRKMVEAARKYNRIVSGATRKRTEKGLKDAIEYIWAGNLGRVKIVRCYSYGMRKSIGKVSSPTKLPGNINYDLWCGPAPLEPLMRENLHYDWHWVWSTGTGQIGNGGIYVLDAARWVLRQDCLPNKVMSIGGRFGYEDDGETPNTQVVYFEYSNAPILYELRCLPKSKEFQDERWSKSMDHTFKGLDSRFIIQCQDGYFSNSRDGNWIYDNKNKRIQQFSTDKEDLMVNFIDAVRSRRKSDLLSEIEDAHLSSALCHMGNIAHRVGKGHSQDVVKEIIDGKMEMLDYYESCISCIDHLSANEVNLKKTPLMISPMLKTERGKEIFTGEFSDQANKFTRRTYRIPYVVPDKV